MRRICSVEAITGIFSLLKTYYSRHACIPAFLCEMVPSPHSAALDGGGSIHNVGNGNGRKTDTVGAQPGSRLVLAGCLWGAIHLTFQMKAEWMPKRFCPLYARSDDLLLGHVLIAALKGYHASFS
jgi:hypothetical protein